MILVVPTCLVAAVLLVWPRLSYRWVSEVTLVGALLGTVLFALFFMGGRSLDGAYHADEMTALLLNSFVSTGTIVSPALIGITCGLADLLGLERPRLSERVAMTNHSRWPYRFGVLSLAIHLGYRFAVGLWASFSVPRGCLQIPGPLIIGSGLAALNATLAGLVLGSQVVVGLVHQLEVALGRRRR